MNSLMSVVIVVTLLAHALLLLYVLMRGGRMRSGRRWLVLTIVISALANAVFFWPPDILLFDNLSSEFVLVVALAALLATYGMVVIQDVLHRRWRAWPLLALVWRGGLVVTALATGDASVGREEWLVEFFRAPDAPGALALSWLAVAAATLLGVAFYGFYVAALPEVANRSLFWVLNTAGVMLGILLAISGTDILYVAGVLILLATLVGATYGLASYRVFDIRGGINAAMNTFLLIGLTSAVIFGTLYLLDSIRVESNDERLLVMVLLALLAGTVYVLARQLAGILLGGLDFRNDPTRAARKYSQQVSKALDLDQLLAAAGETLNEVMGVRRSGMVLVNDTSSDGERVELLVMKSAAFPDVKEMRGYISKSGAVYQQLAVEKAPLSQFDIEFGPQYTGLDEKERAFFRSLQMSAYAPIIVENVLLGVLMCGPKTNDAPYYDRDLELLAIMADQTGVALRNSRSLADLRHLNVSMRVLNAELEEANEQLEKLDAVKTEFITIASHELRTPLAQIRGYTDILDALNEQGMLDKDQIAGMVTNLRKATERTETLISDMLSVSQLDVNAMDLRFTQTAPESVLRMAIEPLTDPLNQRKLSLSARGLRGLPTIYADMQRMVQAFRNILVNAIKFTPDRGRIEINASTQTAEDDETDYVLIAISDTGVGIDPENLELIFEKFYRAYDPGLHSTGTYKFMGAGPGLGLTIARGVIEGHGGKIWAESSGHNMETCPGTTFYVLLPVVPPDDAKRVSMDMTKPAQPVS